MDKTAGPVRMCSVCRKKKPKSALWRIALGPRGAAWDPGGKADGRGLYVCRQEECVRSLARRKNCQKLVGAEALQRICDKMLGELDRHE